MQTTRTILPVWLVFNAKGQYAASDDKGSALDNFAETFGNGECRMVRLDVSVPLQEFVTLTGNVPELGTQEMILKVREG